MNSLNIGNFTYWKVQFEVLESCQPPSRQTDKILQFLQHRLAIKQRLREMEDILMVKDRRRLCVNLPIHAEECSVFGEELQFDDEWLGADEGVSVDVVSDFAWEVEEHGHTTVWIPCFWLIFIWSVWCGVQC